MGARFLLEETEYEVFLKFVDDCYRSPFDSSVHASLSKLIPHVVFCYGSADLATGEIPHVVFCYGSADLATGEIIRRVRRTEPTRIAKSVPVLDPMLERAAVRKWTQTLDPLCVTANSGERAGGSCSALIHGVAAAGREANWYLFVGVGMVRDVRRNQLMMTMLTPHLNAVLAPTLPSVDRAPQESSRLSTRERAVLQWLARGKSAREVADLLAISTYTVRAHVRNILRKLNATNIPHAVTTGLAIGLVVTNDSPPGQAATGLAVSALTGVGQVRRRAEVADMPSRNDA